jgi:hypothetical protein
MQMIYYDSLFHIPKNKLSYSSLVEDLRVYGKGFQDSVKTVDCWVDSGDYWSVPIPYGLEICEGYECRTPNKFMEWDSKGPKQYFNNQIEIIEKCVDFLPKYKRGRIDAPTGLGKSICGLEVARRLNKNCLIIAHKDFILKQFEETAYDIYDIKSGWFHGNKRDIDNPITLTTIQTLNSRLDTLDDQFLNNFGMVIWDEAHYMGADSYLKAIRKLNPDYSLGLTATWRRGDRLDRVFDIHLGPVIVKGVLTGRTTERLLWAPKLPTKISMYNFMDRRGAVSRTKIDEVISEDPAYNSFLLENIPKVVESGRRPVIISNRLTHLDQLYDSLKDLGIDCGIFAGKFKGRPQKASDLKEAAKKDVLLSTPKKVSEGLDLKRYLGEEQYEKLKPLDTIFLSPATKDPEQLCGRIGRYLHGNDPLYIYPVLQTPLIINYFKKACSIYFNREDVKVKIIDYFE